MTDSISEWNVIDFCELLQSGFIIESSKNQNYQKHQKMVGTKKKIDIENFISEKEFETLISNESNFNLTNNENDSTSIFNIVFSI